MADPMDEIREEFKKMNETIKRIDNINLGDIKLYIIGSGAAIVFFTVIGLMIAQIHAVHP